MITVKYKHNDKSPCLESQIVESKPLAAEAAKIAPSPFRRVMTRRNSELDTSENLLTTFGALAS